MSTEVDPRLHRLLGGDDLVEVRSQLRRRYERAKTDAPPTRIRLNGLSGAAHQRLCQLLGRSPQIAQSMTLDVPMVDALLHAAGVATSLRDALEQLDGTIENKVEMREQLRAQWAAALDAHACHERLRAWMATPSATTLVKRLGRNPATAAQLLQRADAVLRTLPGAGITRSQLAASMLGDAHALDDGQPVASLLLAAWRHHEALSAVATEEPIEDDTAADPQNRDTLVERRRAVWARAGVLVNELARPVSFLNLPHPRDAPESWSIGEPDYLSLRRLLRAQFDWPVAGRRIHVCENPDVIAIAADRLGAACAPLVCTDGMPAAAQRTLLDQLVAAGARLHYHGDFDWPGIVIGNLVMRNWNAVPWHFSAADYRTGVSNMPPRQPDLDMATSLEATWDAELGAAMRELGLAVPEEAVTDALVAALAEGL